MNLEEELRRKIRRRCEYTIPGELHRPYRHFSRSKDITSKVGLDDFSTGLKAIGMKLNADEEQALFETIALSGKSKFSYQSP